MTDGWDLLSLRLIAVLDRLPPEERDLAVIVAAEPRLATQAEIEALTRLFTRLIDDEAA